MKKKSKQKPQKTLPKSPGIVELMEKDLEAIVGAGVDLANHNETMVGTAINNQSIQKLSEDDLALICGGRSKEDDDPIGEDN
ncbi:MAG: hypothetical protein AAF215_19890 [Cyanobacteria bacterium P01_A01_bin.123]